MLQKSKNAVIHDRVISSKIFKGDSVFSHDRGSAEAKAIGLQYSFYLVNKETIDSRMSSKKKKKKRESCRLTV